MPTSSILYKAWEKYLSVLFKNFKPDNLELSLLKGEIELRDLELADDVVQLLLAFPQLRVRRALCNCIRVQVPWTRLKQEPVVIWIDEIEINIADPGDEKEVPISDGLSKILTSLNSKPKPAPQSDKPTQYGLMEKIIDGLRLEIVSMHITVHTDANTSLIVDIKNVSLYTTNASWQVVPLEEIWKHNRRKHEVFLFKECALQSVTATLNVLSPDNRSRHGPAMSSIFLVKDLPVRTHLTVRRLTKDLTLVKVEAQVHLENKIRLVLNQEQLGMVYGFLSTFPNVLATKISTEAPPAEDISAANGGSFHRRMRYGDQDSINGRSQFGRENSETSIPDMEESEDELFHSSEIRPSPTPSLSGSAHPPLPHTMSGISAVNSATDGADRNPSSSSAQADPKPSSTLATSGELMLDSFTIELRDEIDGEEHLITLDGEALALHFCTSEASDMVSRPQPDGSTLPVQVTELGMSLASFILVERWPLRGEHTAMISMAPPTEKSPDGGRRGSTSQPLFQTGPPGWHTKRRRDSASRPVLSCTMITREPEPPKPISSWDMTVHLSDVEVVVDSGWAVDRLMGFVLGGMQVTREDFYKEVNTMVQQIMADDKTPCWYLDMKISRFLLVLPVPVRYAHGLKSQYVHQAASHNELSNNPSHPRTDRMLENAVHVMLESLVAETVPVIVGGEEPSSNNSPRYQRASFLYERIAQLENHFSDKEHFDVSAGSIDTPLYSHTQIYKMRMTKLTGKTRFGGQSSTQNLFEINDLTCQADIHALDSDLLALNPSLVDQEDYFAGPEGTIHISRVSLQLQTHQYICLRYVLEEFLAERERQHQKNGAKKKGDVFMDSNNIHDSVDFGSSAPFPPPVVSRPSSALGTASSNVPDTATTKLTPRQAIVVVLELDVWSVELYGDTQPRHSRHHHHRHGGHDPSVPLLQLSIANTAAALQMIGQQVFANAIVRSMTMQCPPLNRSMHEPDNANGDSSSASAADHHHSPHPSTTPVILFTNDHERSPLIAIHFEQDVKRKSSDARSTRSDSEPQSRKHSTESIEDYPPMPKKAPKFGHLSYSSGVSPSVPVSNNTSKTPHSTAREKLNSMSMSWGIQESSALLSLPTVEEDRTSVTGPTDDAERRVRIRISHARLSLDGQHLANVSRKFFSASPIMFPKVSTRVQRRINRVLSATSPMADEIDPSFSDEEGYISPLELKANNVSSIGPQAPGLFFWTMEVIDTEIGMPEPNPRHNPNPIQLDRRRRVCIEVSHIGISGYARPLSVAQDIKVEGIRALLYSMEDENSITLSPQQISDPLRITVSLSHEWVSESWQTRISVVPTALDVALSSSQSFFVTDILKSQLDFFQTAVSAPQDIIIRDGGALAEQVEGIWQSLHHGLRMLNTAVDHHDEAMASIQSPYSKSPYTPSSSSHHHIRTPNTIHPDPSSSSFNLSLGEDGGSVGGGGVGGGSGSSRKNSMSSAAAQNLLQIWSTVPTAREGYLQWKGPRFPSWGGYKRRFFALKGSYLLYVDPRKPLRPEGCVELMGCVVFRTDDKNLAKGKYAFTVRLRSHHRIKMLADSRLDMEGSLL